MKRALSPILLASLLAACPSTGDDDDSAVGTGDMAITVDFAAKAGATDIACGSTYTVGSQDTEVEIKDFRAFVSNIRLIDASGAEVPLALDQDTPWQTADVALLDFEDGSAACSETGTAETNSSVTGTAPEGDYTGIVFDLGVPFDLNHGDSATAPSPLNLVSLQWNWQGGYKFVRFDMSNDNAAPMNNWFLHLGSTGCESDGMATPPTTECAKPNRPTYRFEDFVPGTDTLVFDLADVLAASDVGTNTMDTPPGCMSFPADAVDCATVFPSLGLDWDTGACDGDCAGQQLIRVE